MQASEMPAHLEREDGNRERERDPEAPRHVDEFGARAGRFRRRLRLQRHAADRAVRRDGPAGSADASGRCRSRPPAQVSARSDALAS